MLKLYDYYRSSACYRVRIALNLKQLDYDLIPIHLLNNGGEQHSPAYRRINPHGLVPALEEGTHIITQSIAIIEYLDQLHPAPRLIPADPVEAARVRSFTLSISSDIHPITNLRVLNQLSSEFHASNEQRKKWYQHWIKIGFTALEIQLATRNKQGEFCFGSSPTLADVTLIPQLYSARRFECDLTLYPTLLAIERHCLSLEAFKRASPLEVAHEN